MANKAKPIPEGYSSITPYLIARNAAKAIEFYTQALGAKELFRMPMPDGKIAHAEMMFGNSRIMMADENLEMGIKGPESLGGSAVNFLFYVENVDTAAKRAIDAGMEVIRPVKDQFYGDRSGTFKDPFGHMWTIATHVEDLTKEEVDKRMAEAMPGCMK